MRIFVVFLTIKDKFVLDLRFLLISIFDFSELLIAHKRTKQFNTDFDMMKSTHKSSQTTKFATTANMNKKKITVPKLKTASFVGHNQQQLSAHIIGIAFVLIVGLKR